MMMINDDFFSDAMFFPGLWFVDFHTTAGYSKNICNLCPEAGRFAILYLSFIGGENCRSAHRSSQ